MLRQVIAFLRRKWIILHHTLIFWWTGRLVEVFVMSTTSGTNGFQITIDITLTSPWSNIYQRVMRFSVCDNKSVLENICLAVALDIMTRERFPPSPINVWLPEEKEPSKFLLKKGKERKA